MGWPTIILILLNLSLVIGIFFGRNWLKANIENSVRHKFDERIEGIRTELRKSEEKLKSELRSKELEISTLRDVVLSGRANRQALFDKRQMEAVERLWAAFIALNPYKTVSASMSRIKLERAAERAPHEPNLRKFFEMIRNLAPVPKTSDNPVENEQPFLSPLAWAYFSAYRAVVMNAYATAKVLELGIDKSTELLSTEYAQDLLKAALPHQTEYIEKYKSAGYHNLLDELEQSLMKELKKMLEGEYADSASIKQASAIIMAVKKADEENLLQA